jgi:hypothetical protein
MEKTFHNTTYKKGRRQRRQPLNPPPPASGEGWNGVLGPPRKSCKFQKSSDSKSLYGPTFRRRPHLARVLLIVFARRFLDFRSTFFFPKNRLNLGSAQNAQNLKNLISDRFWLRFWSLFGSLLAPICSIFHDSPKTFILQQVPSETLIFTSQTLSFWNNFSIKF